LSNNWNTATYLSLSTQKRDGTWVNTPVWFAADEKVFYAFSAGNAGKVKRIRNFSSVKICPCNVTGILQGTWEIADATIISANEISLAHSVLLKKYGFQLRCLDFFSAISGKKSKRAFIKIVLSN